MEVQMNLSRTALDNLHIQCAYRFGYGWDMTIGARRNGQTWGEAERRSYEYLTSDELAQVICDEVARLLAD